MSKGAPKTILWTFVTFATWEIVARFGPWGGLPGPTRVVMEYWQNADVYRAHISATALTALVGFLFGNVVAVLAAIIFCRFPTIEQIFRGVNLTLFVIPMLVLGPILVLVFRGNQPQIILSATAVYFPTMSATLVGLREIDPRLIDLVEVYGGHDLEVMRFIRLRSSLPSLLAGLRIASTAAVMGAILGEFGSGVRWGLGTFLLGSLPASEPARLVGIALAASAISLAGYATFALIGGRFVGSTLAVTIAAQRLLDRDVRPERPWGARHGVTIIAATAMPFVLWWALVRGGGLSPIIAPGPLETIDYLLSDAGADGRATLLKALGETLPAAGLSALLGLTAAFALAALAVLKPRLIKAVIPPALALQSTPLVALAPIVLLLFGRDLLASIVMAVVVVFFGAFVILIQGFELVPPTARELVQVYGGSPRQELMLISIPYSISYLIAAAKLVIPRALLGVMVAEWLLTGTGLGHVLDVARSTLEYELVWAGAVVSIVVAVVAYQMVAVVERLVR
jgi:sulfonate transport system permease protein